MERGDVLLEAHKIINGERQDTYGNPEDCFELIADYWTIYLLSTHSFKSDLTPKDVALMMTLFKIARIVGSSDRDSFRDAAGYLGLAEDMCEKNRCKCIDPEKINGHTLTSTDEKNENQPKVK